MTLGATGKQQIAALVHEHTDGRYDQYQISWEQGKPFPRQLLPADAKPFPNPGEGTYVCYTKRHREQWKNSNK